MKPFTLISWSLLLLGITAWVGVVLFYGVIEGKKTERTDRLLKIEQSAKLQISAARIKALANETTETRTALDEVTSVDILSAVKTIEGAGKSIGLSVHIVSASPSGAFSKTNTLHTVSFALESQGSYSSIVRLMKLFESLPLLSMIENVELRSESDPSKPDPKALWHLDLRLKLFTSSNVTS